MKCFNKDYSKIYDSLYKKKNYKKEFNLIKKIIKKNFLTPSSLLDLGCGTGEYSYLMTKLGLKVVGVDRSYQMLKIAKKKYYKNPKLKFLKSDIEKLNLKKKFDIISALFHILSYHTTQSKIESFFLKSHKHLKKNGILIFDFWNKDGVYNLQSPLRIREVETNYLKILRVTISKWYKKLDVIADIHNVTILNKKNKKISKFEEIHNMRYFKLLYIKKLLKKYNYKFLNSLDLQTGKKVSPKSWGALVIAKKIN